jgi:Transcriptional regulators
MGIANEVLKEVTLFQEYASTIQHGNEEAFVEIHLAEIHCINAIGKLKQANVTKIAEMMRMTRGAISKINKKLLQRGLIASYQLPDNQKEIYYKLTESGKQLYDTHAKCHLKATKKKIAVIRTYSSQEQQVILRFFNDLNALSLKSEKKEKSR